MNKFVHVFLLLLVFTSTSFSQTISVMSMNAQNLFDTIDDFEKELPKHESFPTSKDMLTSYIGIYQNEIAVNTSILEILGKADEILLRYDVEN